jgi:LmbE family N-acetylglucosaminyl deacetylase
MLTFKLATRAERPLKILCLGAHSDDIEIGCGGTVLQRTKENRNIFGYWVVFSADQQRKKEASKSANSFLKYTKERTVVIKNFRNGFFPYIGGEIKEYFEALKHAFSPDLIFTHNRHDLHQDHRLVSELTWNTFRDNIILEYEIPKYDGDLGSPNWFVHLDEAVSKRKVRYILDNFATQREKQWFTEGTLLSIMRLRGIESNAPTHYAEAFYCRKAVLE